MERLSTRLKDANGVEIFEGDILQCTEEPVIDIMVWSNDLQYHLKNNYSNNQEELIDWVVIGNITQKEMLKRYDDQDCFMYSGY